MVTTSRAGYARISVSDDRRYAILQFGGNDPLFRRRIDDIKNRLVSARYLRAGHGWRVPLTVQNVVSLTSMLAEYATSVLPFLEQPGLRDVMHDVVHELERTLAASGADDGDLSGFDLSGLRYPERIRPFQAAGIRYALAHKRTFIADDMGLGKTLQAIAAPVISDRLPVLVVCPATLRLNWKREIEHWVAGSPSIQVADGGKPRPIRNDVEWFIVNYDVLHAWKDEIRLFDWETIVLDEAHYVKTATARRSKAVQAIVRSVQPSMTLLLTGTPILNRPAEIWFPLSLIDGQEEFGGWSSFAARYCDPKETRFGTDFTGAANLNELNMRLRSSGRMIRRRKADVLAELPDAMWLRTSMPMSKRGQREYERAEQDLFDYLEQEHGKTYGDGAEALLMISTLRQLAWAAKADACFDWIDRFLETGQKLIVFGWHRAVIDAIAERYDAPRIAGGMAKHEIERGKERFQADPGCRVIACNIAAGGVGHTLTAASDVAFVEFAWNDALMDQALSRAHRLGQQRNVFGHLLAAARDDASPTIDDYMINVIASKGEVTRETVDGLGMRSQRAMIDRLRAMLVRDEDRAGH